MLQAVWSSSYEGTKYALHYWQPAVPINGNQKTSIRQHSNAPCPRSSDGPDLFRPLPQHQPLGMNNEISKELANSWLLGSYLAH